MNKKRAIVLVIDSLGIGAMDDCAEFGDEKTCNTLKNTIKGCPNIKLPNMQKMGLANILPLDGLDEVETPTAQYARMLELSKGKDTTTGHWELAGLVLKEAFKTYPQGFPQKLIDKFIEKTGCKGILGNIPASGTKILEDLAEEHHRTKFPIVYTSADSVFQIAVDVDTIPLDTLYEWCEIARELLNDGYNTSRVIARPFITTEEGYKRVSKDRRDYSLAPFEPTILNKLAQNNGMVFGVGKIEDIFVGSGITHAIHVGSNKEGLTHTLSAVKNKFDYESYLVDSNFQKADKTLIFTNLVDTDMLFGHRRDVKGYGKALEEIDEYVGLIIKEMTNDDLLIITADHGCDPTAKGTDHTRESVPLLIYNKKQEGKNLGTIEGFDFVAKTIEKWLF